MDKKVLQFIEFFIGIVILVILIYRTGIKDIYSTVIQANLLYVALSFLVLFITLLLGALNIKIFIDYLGYQSSFRVIGYYLFNWVISQAFPFRVSSISLIALLTRDNIKLKDCAAATFVDRITTFGVLFSLAAVSLLYFFRTRSIYLYIIFFVVFLIAASIFTFSGRSERILIALFKKFKSGHLTGFTLSSKTIAKNKLLMMTNIMITLVKHVFQALVPYIIFLGFNVKVNFIEFFLISILIITIASLPITTSGLGIRELSAVALYSKLMGIDTVIITSTYLIFLSLKYIMSMFLLLGHLARYLYLHR